MSDDFYFDEAEDAKGDDDLEYRRDEAMAECCGGCPNEHCRFCGPWDAFTKREHARFCRGAHGLKPRRAT